jgi:hypothetical protein
VRGGGEVYGELVRPEFPGFDGTDSHRSTAAVVRLESLPTATDVQGRRRDPGRRVPVVIGARARHVSRARSQRSVTGLRVGKSLLRPLNEPGRRSEYQWNRLPVLPSSSMRANVSI